MHFRVTARLTHVVVNSFDARKTTPSQSCFSHKFIKHKENKIVWHVRLKLLETHIGFIITMIMKQIKRGRHQLSVMHLGVDRLIIINDRGMTDGVA
jgi:hypothetical protein